MVIEARGFCNARLRARIQTAPKRIGRFVLKTPFRVRNLSIEILARTPGASAAKACRLSRDMGCGGYKEPE